MQTRALRAEPHLLVASSIGKVRAQSTGTTQFPQDIGAVPIGPSLSASSIASSDGPSSSSRALGLQSLSRVLNVVGAVNTDPDAARRNNRVRGDGYSPRAHLSLGMVAHSEFSGSIPAPETNERQVSHVVATGNTGAARFAVGRQDPFVTCAALASRLNGTRVATATGGLTGERQYKLWSDKTLNSARGADRGHTSRGSNDPCRRDGGARGVVSQCEGMLPSPTGGAQAPMPSRRPDFGGVVRPSARLQFSLFCREIDSFALKSRSVSRSPLANRDISLGSGGSRAQITRVFSVCGFEGSTLSTGSAGRTESVNRTEVPADCREYAGLGSGHAWSGGKHTEQAGHSIGRNP